MKTLDNSYHRLHISKTMNKKSIKSTKGRPQKVKKESVQSERSIGIPTLFEPTIHDLQDELSRLDSYAYSQHKR